MGDKGAAKMKSVWGLILISSQTVLLAMKYRNLMINNNFLILSQTVQTTFPGNFPWLRTFYDQIRVRQEQGS